MRIAIFSDIHGNCLAFDKVLNDLQQGPVDRLVCLGDAIQGGPQPAQVVGRLRELGCPVVMGNADAWLLTGKETGSESISDERRLTMDAVRNWSLGQLSSADRAFIQAFQPTIELELEAGRKLLCFHGSPASFDDVILPDVSQEALFKYLGAYDAQVMCGGHTHVQYLRRISSDARFFFNPGSTGFAYSHHQPDDDFRADPWAEYAVLTSEGERLALEFRRVPLDAAELIAVYRSSGRPYADAAIAQYGSR
jgi:predicted phosphodiesterase